MGAVPIGCSGETSHRERYTGRFEGSPERFVRDVRTDSFLDQCCRRKRVEDSVLSIAVGSGSDQTTHAG